MKSKNNTKITNCPKNIFVRPLDEIVFLSIASFPPLRCLGYCIHEDPGPWLAPAFFGMFAADIFCGGVG